MALENKNKSISLSFLNNAGCRENRAECIADQTAFEDAVYAIVDSMMLKEGANETI